MKRIQKHEPRVRQPLICNKQGNAYTVDGFNTIFYRAMAKALADPDNLLTERFQFRDLRAKSPRTTRRPRRHRSGSGTPIRPSRPASIAASPNGSSR